MTAKWNLISALAIVSFALTACGKSPQQNEFGKASFVTPAAGEVERDSSQFQPARLLESAPQSPYQVGSQVTVSVAGDLLSGCHVAASYVVQAVPAGASTDLVVTQYSYEKPGNCTQATVPFETDISFGKLPAGQYQILNGENHSVIGAFEVR